MPGEQPVVVVDVKMPFLSMVVFLVKLAIASIPATIILMFVATLMAALFGGIFAGMGRFV